MPPPLTVSSVRLWLETIERAYGPDVPLLLVATAAAWPVRGDWAPTRAPIVDMLLDTRGGTPAVLLIAATAASGSSRDQEHP